MDNHREGGAASETLLGVLGSEQRFLMFLDDNGRELKVMENPETANPKFYMLKRA